MQEYLLHGFCSEMEKLAGIKENLPWAVSRGITGALSTLAIGLTMSDALKNMKKQDKEHRGTMGKLKTLLPVATTGAITGTMKGFAEKAIESGMKGLLHVK